MYLIWCGFALLGFAFSFFLSPNVGKESRSDGAFVAAPMSFVRGKILDYELMSGLQSSGISGSLDGIRLEYEGTGISALNAKPGNALIVTDRFGDVRAARVVANSPRWFVYRENLWYGQRITHNITFNLADPAVWGKQYPTPSTILLHERKWTGSPIFLMLRSRWDGVERWVGTGLPEGTARGLSDLRLAIEKLCEEKSP